MKKIDLKSLKNIFVALICAAALLFAAGCENYNSYKAAVELFENGQYEEAAGAFDALGDYKDASERADAARDKIYEAAELLFGQSEYEKAIEKFSKLGGYRDAPGRIETIKKQIAYEAAVALMEQGEYEEAAKRFTELGAYKDASELADDSQHKFAEALFGQGKYEQAIGEFSKLGGYKDASGRIETIKKQIAYEAAVALMENGKYEEAAKKFEQIGEDALSKEALNLKDYMEALELFERKEYELAVIKFESLGDFKDSPLRAEEARELCIAILTVVSADFANIGHIKSLRFNGENGSEVAMSGDWNEWFVNATIVRVWGLELDGMSSSIMNQKNFTRDSGFTFNIVFDIDGEEHNIIIKPGTQFITRPTNAGYVLLSGNSPNH